MILGIDPGLASTGWAVVVREGSRLRVLEHGMVRTSPRAEHAARLRALHDGIAELLVRHAVSGAAVESWFVHPVSRAAMGMAEARGAIMVALAGAGVAVTEYAPNAVKQGVTGQGRADKAQVRAMVARLVGVEPPTDHVADAMALAICHLGSGPLRAAIRRAQ